MGGYTFISDSKSANPRFFYMNLPMRHWWAESVIAAGETAVLDNARCPYDEDGECAIHGCLNSGCKRGWQMPINDFLEANERVLAFTKTMPEKLPDQQVVWSPNPEQEEWTPGAILAIPILQELIASIRQVIENGGKVVFMFDRLSDPDAFPCPREFSYRRLPNPDEIDQCLKDGSVIPGGIIESRLISYAEAVAKKESGEWEANQRECFCAD